jgi:DMSO/TMAO reductase YedYZ molybdopterin-dependent catalytic subunit
MAKRAAGLFLGCAVAIALATSSAGAPLIAGALSVAGVRQTAAQAVTAGAELKIGGEVKTPLVLTVADLKKMPRKTLSVVNPHDKKTEVFEGVALEYLLGQAGVPQGEKLRGAAMATYVVAEGTDGYHVIFSLAELDSGMLDSDVIVADTMDGAPLGTNEGPFRLVAPHEKRPARWVRMLKSITVVRPSA